MASIARLMVVTSKGPAPCIGRQFATAGTCAPMKTPVGLLRNACRLQPTRSKVSHAQVSSIRTWGSVNCHLVLGQSEERPIEEPFPILADQPFPGAREAA